MTNLQGVLSLLLMNVLIKYDISCTCKAILKEQLQKLDVEYNIVGLNEIEFKIQPTSAQIEQLKSDFSYYGIEIIDNQKLALVQKIKDTIIDMVWSDDILPNITTSSFLADKLHHSYGYLANLFSEYTFATIENFIIFQKIERVKEMTINGNHTLTEISYQLNYSSVAHLSNQFKKTTGLTPSAFQRIIKQRKALRDSM